MAPIRREETPSTPPDGSDMSTLREAHIAIGAVSRRVGEIDEKLERLGGSVNELAETIGQISASLARLEAAAGTTPATRVGSSPQLDRLIDIRLDDEETEVRARRLELEKRKLELEKRQQEIRAAEMERAAANQRRAQAWGLAYKWAALVGPWVGALLGAAIMRQCGA